jgi:replicative DNA helicase
MYEPTAEMAVLACCLRSKVARDKSAQELTGLDFYLPVNQAIWEAMQRLHRQGMEVDGPAVLGATAGDWRQRAQQVLVDLPGYPVVLEAISTHCHKVREKAQLRRVYAEAQRTVQLCLNPDVDPIGLAASAVTRYASIRDDGQMLGEDMETMTVEELMLGVDPEPDWVIPGFLERADRFILTGEEGLGKALALDTPVPTPRGWTTMGELEVGDEVFSPDGSIALVVAATEAMSDRPCYRVTFSDGAEVVADANHLWATQDYGAREKQRPAKVRTTEQIAKSVTAGNLGRINHSIEVVAPLAYRSNDLLLDPYVLGAWLGDGSSKAASIVTHDDDVEIISRIAETWPVRKLKAEYAWGIGDGRGKGARGTATFAGCLRALGVFGDKHIPEPYLRASVDQRLALLQGLMDTDGTVSERKRGGVTCEFSVTSERLATDVLDLLLGLGVKVSMKSGPAVLDSRVVGMRYRLAFATDLPVFHLERKARRLQPLRTLRAKRRYIVAVTPVESVPVRCIQVGREDGMFVVGRECIATHNSHLLRQIVILASAGLDPFRPWNRIEPVRGMIIDFENSKRQVRRRLSQVYDYALRGKGAPGLAGVLPMQRADITSDRILNKIHRELDVMQPDVLVIGPLYRMSPTAIKDDSDASPILSALDTIRDRGIAVLIEAHAGHTTTSGGQGRTRDLRPRGSSALLGWPEFGYGMKGSDNGKDAVLIPWRGDRDVRNFPLGLTSRDGMWTEARPLTVREAHEGREDWGGLAEEPTD